MSIYPTLVPPPVSAVFSVWIPFIAQKSSAWILLVMLTPPPEQVGAGGVALATVIFLAEEVVVAPSLSLAIAVRL